MIYEVTGRNPLDFNGYGCWCGYGGKGDPVDALDRWVSNQLYKEYFVYHLRIRNAKWDQEDLEPA